MRFFCPRTLDELLDLRSRLNEQSMILAGGTDLLAKHRQLSQAIDIIDIGRCGLSFITPLSNAIAIGAATTASEIILSELVAEHIPILRDAASQLGSPQIRSRATVGGNLCNCSPSADMVCALTALRAKIEIMNKYGSRIVDIEEFSTGPGTNVLTSHEILTAVHVPFQDGRHAFLKVGRRNALAIAIVAVGVVGRALNGLIEDISISISSVSPTIVRARTSERALKGQPPGEHIYAEAVSGLMEDISPLDDVRASASYRKHCAMVLLSRSLAKVFS